MKKEHGFLFNNHFFKKKCDGKGIFLEWVLNKHDNTMIVHPFYCVCKIGQEMKKNKILKPFIKDDDFYYPLDSHNKPISEFLVKLHY